jgi:DNA (cytosine-5)-methyltransferase 1
LRAIAHTVVCSITTVSATHPGPPLSATFLNVQPHTNESVSVKQPDNPCPLTSLELFAGAGGLSLGIAKAGFKCLGLIERNETAGATLVANARQLLRVDPAAVTIADIEDVDFSSLPHVDLLSGGPPCQPFSLGGKNLGSEDPRNMFPALLHAVGTVLPRAVLIENVKGLAREKFSDYFAYIRKQLEFPTHQLPRGCCWKDHFARLSTVRERDVPLEEQYSVGFQVIDSADFGVPQRRERILITAFRKDSGVQPFLLDETHSREALLVQLYETKEYWQKRGLTPPNSDGSEIFTRLRRLRTEKPELFERQPWVTVRDALLDLPEPRPRGSEECYPFNHIQHPGARSYPGHSGSEYDAPAKALKAGAHGTPGGENILRVGDSSVRYFTTREAARLQTFPDEWRFTGSWGACIRQLGNAVPVRIAELFAREVFRRLNRM